ncbi:unnamed protein product [Protopolystoma xenopodis]|uniref:Uncharacterized protein n=1 Tax=Protopolystoma xenopodis TaxID=117903 RepID=A0A448WKU2_9PLAT|nr:unnamed protein product [Protopolystoma xenopodis]
MHILVIPPKFCQLRAHVLYLLALVSQVPSWAGRLAAHWAEFSANSGIQQPDVLSPNSRSGANRISTTISSPNEVCSCTLWQAAFRFLFQTGQSCLVRAQAAHLLISLSGHSFSDRDSLSALLPRFQTVSLASNSSSASRSASRPLVSLPGDPHPEIVNEATVESDGLTDADGPIDLVLQSLRTLTMRARGWRNLTDDRFQELIHIVITHLILGRVWPETMSEDEDAEARDDVLLADNNDARERSENRVRDDRVRDLEARTDVLQRHGREPVNSPITPDLAFTVPREERPEGASPAAAQLSQPSRGQTSRRMRRRRGQRRIRRAGRRQYSSTQPLLGVSRMPHSTLLPIFKDPSSGVSFHCIFGDSLVVYCNVSHSYEYL